MTPERRAELAKLAADALSRSLAVTTGEREALDVIVLWFASGGTGPGHWEVKDFADGWIRCDDETSARRLAAEQSDAAVRFVPYVGTLPAR